ncbi:MAG: porin family protein [bacterium]|nr:porin family protein [bacterium]
MKRFLVIGILGLFLGISSIASAETSKSDKNFVISVGYGYFFNGADKWDGTAGIGFGFFLADAMELNITVNSAWDSFGDSVSVLLKPNFYFNTQSNVNPYMGIALGATFNGGTDFTYGVQIGAKQFISENTFIQYEIGYQRIEDVDSNSVVFALGLGFKF